MRYTDEEYRGREKLRDSILSGCSSCKGTGVQETKEGVRDCQCMMIFDWLCELKDAGIPEEYWALSLDNLETDAVAKSIVSEYCDNLGNAVKRGLGLFLFGSLGLGKTSLMSCIGKVAIREGYPVIYTTVQRYIDSIIRDDANVPQIDTASVILLDEIDKVYVKQGSDWVRKRLEELLRRAIPQHRAVVIATNWNEEDVEKTFGASLMSLLRGHLKFVAVSGEDYRGKLAAEWDRRLTESPKTDYWQATIVSDAQEYDEAKRKRREEMFDEKW